MLSFVVFGEIDLVLDLETELRQGKEGKESGDEHGHIEMGVLTEVEGDEVKGKEPLDEDPGEVDALDAEEATGEHDDAEGEEDGRDAANPLIELLQEELVGTDEDALQRAIHHEVPRGTMPETGDEETEP